MCAGGLISSRASAQLGERVSGDAACTGCHQAESQTYAHTAHHLTSQSPAKTSILGNFAPDHRDLVIVPDENPGGLPSLQFHMDSKDGSFTETALSGSEQDRVSQTETIGLVTGSGKRGQTYLFWRGDALFELPVSYWTEGSRWINSPGYQNGTANFSRPVTGACLECHASSLQQVSEDLTSNHFRKETLQTGITCERCHGSGAAHIARYQHQPVVAGAAVDAIVNPAKLSRERQVELCAYCHSGIQRIALAPAFSYTAGQPLANYFKPMDGAMSDHPDVHGNQVGLLERSRCFQQSGTMTCSTCHNTHTQERAAASYSAVCLGCHTWQGCKVAQTIGVRARENCIDCHMPVERTNVIVSQTAGEELHATMRNHWIKVYPGARLP